MSRPYKELYYKGNQSILLTYSVEERQWRKTRELLTIPGESQ